MGPDDTYTLDVSTYSGGIAVWGAVQPVYDTTRLTIDTGVHIHARDVPTGSKRVDGTYRSVILGHRDLPGGDFIITEWDAIYFMVTSVFGFQTKEVLSPRADILTSTKIGSACIYIKPISVLVAARIFEIPNAV